jgi:hypothetical protein
MIFINFILWILAKSKFCTLFGVNIAEFMLDAVQTVPFRLPAQCF